MVVNRDSFFLSHRLPLARGARTAGMEVVVAAGDSGRGQAIADEGFEFVPLPVTRGALNPLSEARTFAFLLRLYRRLRPALVYHNTVQPVIYGSVAARLAPEPEGGPVVVLPARMLWDKGVREFVDAARRLRARGTAARFILVGAPDNGNREAIPTQQLDGWSREGLVEWWGHRSDMPAV